MTKEMSLLEQLRDLPRSWWCRGPEKDTRYLVGELMHQAADEIERLRNDIQELTCGDPRLVSSAVEPTAPHWTVDRPNDPCINCGGTKYVCTACNGLLEKSSAPIVQGADFKLAEKSSGGGHCPHPTNPGEPCPICSPGVRT